MWEESVSFRGIWKFGNYERMCEQSVAQPLPAASKLTPRDKQRPDLGENVKREMEGQGGRTTGRCGC